MATCISQSNQAPRLFSAVIAMNEVLPSPIGVDKVLNTSPWAERNFNQILGLNVIFFFIRLCACTVVLCVRVVFTLTLRPV